jgi:uncharacterized protein
MISRFPSIGFGIAAAVVLSSGCSLRATEEAVVPVPYARVDITDEFWAPKIEVNRTVSIQHLFRKYEELGRGDTLRAIEAAAYMLGKRRDPDLERYVDELIDTAVASTDPRLARPESAVRTSGYLLEAGVAYFRATGKRKLLDEAIKAADAIDASYGPGKRTYISGHEGLKIGLLSLYQETADPRYLKLAQFFLDERGKDDYSRQGEYAIDRTYAQDHQPVIRQREAVGHAVRATYLYIPLTELAAITASPDYSRAADAIWEDAAFRKTYVTGGIGSIRFHEQFGAPYELPNLSAWNETCASYGSVVWNERMFLLHRDARYVDQLERVLYNAFLDGVSARGDRFFYQNPLTSYGNYDRFDWINTPCCPPNVVRLIASLGGYIYAQTKDRDFYVNLFVGSRASVVMGGTTVAVQQQTRYPWDGRVRITVDPERAASFALHVRIPGWTGMYFMPGDLYHFGDSRHDPLGITVNGRPVRAVRDSGFAVIDRRWNRGDTIELDLPMPVRRVMADARVKDDEGRVALARGPLVFAAEWPDNGGHALNVVVPDAAAFSTEFRRDLLGGVQVITGNVQAVERGADGRASLHPHRLVAIPYYAWANRGMGEMQVWLPRRAEKARITPVALPDGVAAVRSSGGIDKKWTGYNDQNDDIAAVYDGIDPLSSADESNLYFRMRPPVGAPAWIEYELKSPASVSSAEVYFADDRRFCKLPESWRVLVKSREGWTPVTSRGAYTVERNRFNRVQFDPVTTTAVRIEIEPRTVHYNAGEIGPPDAMFLDAAAEWRELGVIEWRVK